MKQVHIDNYIITAGTLVDEVADLLNEREFNVELFGVNLNDRHLGLNYDVVDYGSRDTLVKCIDGNILDDEDMEKEENISTIICSIDITDELARKHYDDSQIQNALVNYDWDEVFDRYVELIDLDLKAKAHYFNMKSICEYANVNYSTYRGWANQGRGFSLKLKIKLLNAMKKVGE